MAGNAGGAVMGRIVDMPLPRMGETMDEGRIGLIIKKPGERFRRGETLLEVESDKTTVEVPALQDGLLLEWLVAVDQMVPVESAIARIEIEGEAMAEVKAASSPDPSLRRKPEPRLAMESGLLRNDRPGMRPRASTAARAAARRAGLDLTSVTGTGRNGRITRADLAAASRPARATYHVETPLGKIHVREWPAQGANRGTALLIHGLFADSQSFTTLGRKLAARGFRTLAVDLPGHGESHADASALGDVVATVKAAMPATPLHIIGHSYGALIATHLRDHALSLTLLSPVGCGEEINSAFIDAMLGGRIDHAIQILGESVPLDAQAGLADHLSRHGSQLRTVAASVSDEGRQGVSILAKLAGFSIPVRAVFMRDDAVIPAHHALNMPPNVAVRFLPGTSHLPHWRDPDLIARLLAE